MSVQTWPVPHLLPLVAQFVNEMDKIGRREGRKLVKDMIVMGYGY